MTPLVRRLLAVAALALPLTAAGAVGVAQTASWAAPAETSFPVGGAFAVQGHGYGHGRGLSQWGAYGAARSGLSSGQILDFYYPGTASTDGGNPLLRVLLKRDEGIDTVTVPSARTGALHVVDHGTGERALDLPPAVGPAPVSLWRAVVASPGTLRLEGLWGGAWQGYPAGAPWTTAGTLEFSAATGRVTLAYPGGGQQDYRGTLRAVPTGGRLASVNLVDREDYLRGVVPSESPSSWPAAALEAQAVAARTYAASVAVPTAASDICDDTYCQVYSGIASYSPTGALLAAHEAASTDGAVARTARTLRTWSGRPAFTQFSASNGGASTAGTSAQPYLVARADPYDGVVPNSAHDWTVSLSADQVGAATGTGRAVALRVEGRDGLGDWGGRTTAVTVIGTNGTRTLGAEDFRSRLGLKSTLWVAAPGVPPSSADLYLAAVSGTGSGAVEVHALGRSSGYTAFTVHAATAQPVMDPARATFLFGSWDGSGGRDLFIVLSSGTGTHHVEVHVLSAASGYRQWVVHAVTPLPEVSTADWQFRLSPVAGGPADLVGVLGRGGSGRVEVHALSGTSSYGAWTVHAATALPGGSTGLWSYLVGPAAPGRPAGDLVAVARTGTGSGRTEVHTLSEASGYTAFTVHAATPLGATPSSGQQFGLADVDGDGVQDLVMTATTGTGSGRTEVHTLSGASGFGGWLDHLATGLPQVDPRSWKAAVER